MGISICVLSSIHIEWFVDIGANIQMLVRSLVNRRCIPCCGVYVVYSSIELMDSDGGMDGIIGVRP
jgi:hypothetical protein